MNFELLTRSCTAIAAAAAVLATGAPFALAADGEKTPLDLSQTPTRAAEATGGSGGIVRTIVGLAVVIAVIYGLTWVLKQVKGSREDRATGTGLQALATLPLGPNRSLHLVQAGGEVVLLGAGEGGITPIRTYSSDEARSLGVLEDEGDDDSGAAPSLTENRRGFIDALRRRTVIR